MLITDDKPPLLILAFLGVIIFILIAGLTQGAKTSHKPTVSLESCFYHQPNIPYIPTTYVLGTLVDEQLYEIIKCESNFQPDVCSYAGCGSGMGLAQLIPSTVKYCEKKLGKEINPFNPEENLECANWLYENEGVRHWKQSQECWKNI